MSATILVVVTGIAGLIGGIVITTFLALTSKELMGWLDRAPQAVLRLAALQLHPTQRESLYSEEWLPELLFILREADGRPITRFIRGVTFALGLVIAARRVSRLRPSASTQAIPIGGPLSIEYSDSTHRLTPRQRQVLLLIRNSVVQRGYPPSLREIAQAT